MDMDEKRRIREAHYATTGLFGSNKIQMPGEDTTNQPAPNEDDTKSLDELREEYKKVVGKPPNQRWSASYLEAQIKEANDEIDKA